MEKTARLGGTKGLALVAVLLLLLVLSVVGGTVFLMTGADLKIAVNAEQQVSTLYAAEAGVHSLLAFYRSAPEAFFQKRTGPPLPFPVSSPETANWAEFRIWLADLQYDPAAVPRYVACTVQAQVPWSQAAAQVKTVIAHNPMPAAFQAGLVTDGPVQIAAGGGLRTGLHANRGYSLEPLLVAELRQNQYPLTQAVDPAAEDYRPPVPVPFLAVRDLEYYRSRARNGNNLLLEGNQELSLSGDQGGRLVFVDGDLQVRGTDLSGVTLVAAGTLTFSGNTRLNSGQQVDTALIAARDLIMTPSGETSGVFWCGGSFIPSGGGNLQGLIVSQGGLRAGPSFRFTRLDRIENPYLPPPSSGPAFVLKGWLQL